MGNHHVHAAFALAAQFLVDGFGRMTRALCALPLAPSPWIRRSAMPRSSAELWPARAACNQILI